MLVDKGKTRKIDQPLSLLLFWRGGGGGGFGFQDPLQSGKRAPPLGLPPAPTPSSSRCRSASTPRASAFVAAAASMA